MACREFLELRDVQRICLAGAAGKIKGISIKMADQIPSSGSDTLDVRLNEAFTRLEKRDMSEPKESPKTKPIQPGNLGQPAAGTGIAGVLAVFLALVAIGMSSYIIFHLFGPSARSGQATAPAATTQATLSDALSARLSTLQNKQTEQSRQFQQNLEELSTRLVNQSGVAPEELDVALLGLRTEMLGLLGTSSQDWLFAEVEFLLRMANQRILMERDPQGALALLRAADDVVRDARGIMAFDLRAAISEDLGRLSAVEALDVDGLYLRLMTLIRQVETLPQRGLRYSASDDQTAVRQSSGASRFTELMREAGARLSQLVDYRASGVVITPILPPQEEYYLRQNLVLQLQMAQLALLRGDPAIYAGALAEAQRWVPAYFDVESARTRAMMAMLDNLASTDISQEFPDISGSLRVAREHMARFQGQPARVTAPTDLPGNQKAPGVAQ
ncbi:MAG: uroporphyrin-3 C-methyltransferase [Candidatus Azotimanducaceae bacterium]